MRIIVSVLFLLFFFLSTPVFSAALDVNTASIEQLQTIKGIGTKTAKSIVDYRQTNGNFKSVDDLTQVKGIGDKKLAKIREHISVGQPMKKHADTTPTPAKK